MVGHTPPVVCDLDDHHHIYLVGYDAGYAAGQLAASQDLARQWLAQTADDMETLAVQAAAVKGPHWVAAIRDQARPPRRRGQ